MRGEIPPAHGLVGTTERGHQTVATFGRDKVDVKRSVILVEDTTGKGHRTRRIGDTPRETLFISLPEE